MPKKYYASDIQKLEAEKMRDQIGNVHIKDKDGKPKTYSSYSLKHYLKKFFKGGKTAYTLNEHLRKDAGVSGQQALKRQKIVKFITGSQASRTEMRVAERTKNAIRKRNINASRRMSEMLQAKRSERLSGILKEDGNIKTTSERIGVSSRKFGVHYGVSAIESDSSRTSANSNSIENVVAERDVTPLTGFAAGQGVGKNRKDIASSKSGQLSNFGASGSSGGGKPGSGLLNFYKK